MNNTMNNVNRNFIKIQTVAQHWNGSSYDYIPGDAVLLDADVIVEIHPLNEIKMFQTLAARNRYEKPVPAKAAYVYRSTIHGHGVNGVDTDMLVDEDSYYRILDALGIPKNIM